MHVVIIFTFHIKALPEKTRACSNINQSTENVFHFSPTFSHCLLGSKAKAIPPICQVFPCLTRRSCRVYSLYLECQHRSRSKLGKRSIRARGCSTLNTESESERKKNYHFECKQKRIRCSNKRRNHLLSGLYCPLRIH
jgi:hypothetical protein